jgi:hypothetical protein
MGAGQLLPVALLDCPNEGTADQVAAVLMEAQNGTRTMASGEMPIFFGDTALGLRVFRETLGREGRGRLGRAWAELVAGGRGPRLTCDLVIVSPLEEGDIRIFSGLVQLRRSYSVTVGVGGRPEFERLDVVKYPLTGLVG